MFRMRYLLAVIVALGTIVAATGIVPRVAAAQEKDRFNCPMESVCFYDDPAFNFDTQSSERRNPEVVMDPGPARDASEVCLRLEHQKVPFMAGSARNNTGDAYLELFADDNCSTPVIEPEGGRLNPGGRAYEIVPQAQSLMVVDLSTASSASQLAQQRLKEAGGAAGDDVDLGDFGSDLLGEQDGVTQTQREANEHAASEVAHERSRVRRVQRLLLGDAPGGREASVPAGAELQELGIDEERQSSHVLHEVLQGQVPVPKE